MSLVSLDERFVANRKELSQVINGSFITYDVCFLCQRGMLFFVSWLSRWMEYSPNKKGDS